MSSIALPVGFPAGVDPSAGFPDFFQNPSVPGQIFRVTVPGGECWLVHSIGAPFQTGAGAQARFITCTIEHETQLMADVASIGPIGASVSGFAAFGLGQQYGGGFTAGASSGMTAPLPWLILKPSWAIVLTLDSDAGDAGFRWTLSPYFTLTKWDLGSGSSSAEQLGPFMFVPGPNHQAA